MSIYATANLYNKYKQESVNTASPIELIIMLYDGGIKQLKLAKIFHEDKNWEEYNKALEKAQDILLELISSLNLKLEISQNLLELYQFLTYELVKAASQRKVELIDPVIEMMTSLNEAWTDVKQSGVTL